MLRFQIDKHVRTYPDGATKEWYQAYMLPRRWWKEMFCVSQSGALFFYLDSKSASPNPGSRDSDGCMPDCRRDHFGGRAP